MVKVVFKVKAPEIVVLSSVALNFYHTLVRVLKNWDKNFIGHFGQSLGEIDKMFTDLKDNAAQLFWNAVILYATYDQGSVFKVNGKLCDINSIVVRLTKVLKSLIKL